MIKEYEKYETPIIGLHQIDKKDSDKYGIVEVGAKKGDTYRIKNLIEKPSPGKAPSNLAVAGKYIITPDLLETLAESKPGTKDKELRLIDGMREFVKHSEVHGYIIKGERFDTGDKLGYLKAVTHFALKHKDLSKEYFAYLKKLTK